MSPEETKTALSICTTESECPGDKCPYNGVGGYCRFRLKVDALSYIEQLEKENTRMKQQEEKTPDSLSKQIKIKAHSDKEILDACISLIDGVLNGEYGIYQQLADDDFDFDAFEERFDCKMGFSYSNFEIVQRLFLMGTNHSGGTSTRAKCRELGVDAGEAVDFSRRLEDDDE